nr:probable phosphoinositide phosphatase SAC9 isoform X1 [Tanacetum cinerariifolium]
DLIWVCPQAADVMELFIYLGEPCHVCQLLLTISHGADSSTFPSRVDVRTGPDLDGLKLVVEVPSRPFGCLLKPVASILPSSDDGSSL